MADEKRLDIQSLYNLSYITRYSNVARIKNENVAEHSFFVAVEILDLYQKYEFNLEEALKMAITHDFVEEKTDDVNHLIKGKYPKLKAALKEAEMEEMKVYPEFIQDSIREYDEGLTFEAIIVHIADARQCTRYSRNQINRGNVEYMSWVNAGSLKRVKTLIYNIATNYPERIRKKMLD